VVTQQALLEWRTYAALASAAIALVALFRPELTKLFVRHFGEVKLYPVGKKLEVGYGGVGATVAVELIVRAKARDFFVTQAAIEVVRSRDGAKYHLDWAALRPTGILLGSGQSGTYETPAGFLLEPRNPRRLHIVFNDFKLLDEVNSILEPLRQTWWTQTRPLRQEGPSSSKKEDTAQALAAAYVDFRNSSVSTTAWTEIHKLCYWQSGEYTVVIRISTGEPERDYLLRGSFELTKSESDALYANAVIILDQNAGFNDLGLYFARPVLQIPRLAEEMQLGVP
jgi:hypothetical protein